MCVLSVQSCRLNPVNPVQWWLWTKPKCCKWWRLCRWKQPPAQRKNEKNVSKACIVTVFQTIWSWKK